MSTSVRGRMRGRISLLTSSSLVATAILAGAGALGAAALAPSAVQAAVCTPAEGGYATPAASPGGTVACGPGTASSIGYTSTGVNTNLTLDSGLSVNAGGVSLVSFSGSNLGVTVVTGGTGGSINAAGTGESGMLVVSSGGNVAIDTGPGGYAVTGDLSGIVGATSGAGTVTILGSGPVTGGAGGSGIGAFNTVGTGAVSVGQSGAAYSGAVSGGLYGVSASGQRAVSVYTSADVTGAALMGIGVSSVAGGGTVTIVTSGGTVTGFTGGIGASTTNANAVNITNGDVVVTTLGNGIGASSGSGAINITSTGASIQAADAGIGVTTTGAITVSNGSAITGATIGGISVGGLTGTGAISVTNTGDLSALSGAAYGIGAKTLTGQITIVNSGNVGASGTGNGVDNFGVGGQAVGANTAGVSVTNHGAIFVDGTLNTNPISGVSAINAGTGTVTLVNTGAVTVAGGPALLAQGAGDVSVTNSGAVSGDVGIQAQSTSAGSATVSVISHASVTGTVGAGILASNTGAGGVDVQVAAATALSPAPTITGATNGIDASGAGPIGVHVAGNVTGTTGLGVSAVGATGSVTVSTSAGAINGKTGGIFASTSGSTANISVTNSAAVTTATGIAINAQGVLGAVSVVSTGALSGDVGVRAQSTSAGLVSVAQEGDITATIDGIEVGNFGPGGASAAFGDQGGTQTLSAAGGDGVSVFSLNGAATVQVGKTGNTGATTITANGAGVASIGFASSTVTLGDNVTIDPDDYGILAVSAGTAKVVTGNHDSITVDDNVVAGNDDVNYGVFATSQAATDGGAGAESVQVALGTNNTIVVKDSSADGQADGGLAVAATNTGSGTAGISVTAGNGLNINVTGNNAGGIGAATSFFGGGDGSGNVSITTGTGTITIAGGANVTDTANNFPGSFGIAGLTDGGNVTINTAANISVGNNAPGPNAAIGVLAQTLGSGTVSITTSGTINVTGPNAVGVAAGAGTGTVAINVNGAVHSTDVGVESLAVGNSTITVGAAGSVRGAGPVIEVFTGTGTASVSTITNKGLIASNSATTALQAADTAIAAFGGSLVVNNNAGGTLNGLIDVSGLTTVGTGTAKLTFNNAGTWNFAGTETLTAGADAISNTGTINTVGTSKIDFGAGANTFANAGTIKVGGAGAATAAASLTLSNLAVLNNSGVIDVHDGLTNRSFATTATLNGTGASQLYVDAALGGPGSTASAVTIGGSSGLTAIRVNNTNAGGVGAYIPDPANGIVLVTGATSLSNFRISELSDGYNGPGLPTGANGTIAAPGMFFYDLAANGNKIVLVSAPKVAAFQFAQIGAIAGDAWTTTTQSWFDRQADLRDTLGARAAGSAPAVWMKVVGDWSRRDSGSSLTVAGKTYGYDTSYKGDTAAIIAGVDLLHGADNKSAWVIGVQGGYVDANARFRNSSTRLNLTGGVVGVYASYLQGGLFVDGIINGNVLTGDWNIPSLGVGVAPWTTSSHVNTWGGQLEAGYAFPMGASAFIEPVGSIAYGRTTTGQLNLALGANQTFGDSDTLRGSLGGRVGTTASFQYYKVKLAIEGRVWDEFDGKTNTALGNAGATFLNANDISGVYGEVKGEANLFAAGDHLSAFLNTGIKWKARYQDTSVSLGVRYQW